MPSWLRRSSRVETTADDVQELLLVVVAEVVVDDDGWGEDAGNYGFAGCGGGQHETSSVGCWSGGSCWSGGRCWECAK